jgi:hypothetical protein
MGEHQRDGVERHAPQGLVVEPGPGEAEMGPGEIEVRTGVAPSKRKVSPPLDALTGRLATLLPMELVRKEMIVALPLTAEGTK